MTTAASRAAILTLLAAVMVATRLHHFGAVPDASWAVFFVGGMASYVWLAQAGGVIELGAARLFGGLMAGNVGAAFAAAARSGFCGVFAAASWIVLAAAA